MDKNKQLAKLLRLCWHEWVPIGSVNSGQKECSKCHTEAPLHLLPKNPDFTTPDGIVLLLKEMMKREDFNDFWDEATWDVSSLVYVLNTTGKLRDAAIEWLEP